MSIQKTNSYICINYNVTINQKIKKMKVSVFIMMKKTTNNNATVKNEVAPVKKTTPKTTAVAVVNNTDLTNKSVKSKLLTFDETMQLMIDCGIGSKSKSKNYRIMNGGSSIHVLKTMYRIYMTNIDFDLCRNLKSLNTDDNIVIELMKNDNSCDEKRPNTVLIHNTDVLKKVFTCLSHNKLNAPC